MDAALIARMKAAANQLAVPLGAGPEGVALSPALCLLLRAAVDALEAQVAPERPTYSRATKQAVLDGTIGATGLIERLAREAGIAMKPAGQSDDGIDTWYGNQYLPNGSLAAFAALVADECARTCEAPTLDDLALAPRDWDSLASAEDWD